MNPAVSGFRVVVRQVNLARPALARHHISGEDAAPSTAPSLRKVRQLGIHLIGMSPIDRVRAILDGDKVGSFTSLAVRRPEA